MVALLIAAGCGTARPPSSDATPRPAATRSLPARFAEAAVCEEWLSRAELGAALGTSVGPPIKIEWTCYWQGANGTAVKLTVPIDIDADAWLDSFLASGALDEHWEPAAGYPFRAVTTSGGFAAAVGGRSALIKAELPEAELARLVRLVIDRL